MEVVGEGHDLINKAPGNAQISLSAVYQEGGGRMEGRGGGFVEDSQKPDQKGTW